MAKKKYIQPSDPLAPDRASDGKPAAKAKKTATKTNSEGNKKSGDEADVKLPSFSQDAGRDSSGRFTAGHTKVGGIQQGAKHKLSLRVQNSVLSMVANEVESDRFTSGLPELRFSDPKGYYQVLAALMKFCAPTLQSQSLEIQGTEGVKTIDDKLNELMHTVIKD